jgi:hypothetical protein
MTNRRAVRACWTVACLAVAAVPADAQVTGRPALRAERAVRPPVIDGLLDDEVWEQSPLATGDWLSYNPLHGDRIPQRTTVWAAYDAEYLYFAFKCDDPDPSGIKTSVTRRDNIWQDDWVGLSLDAQASNQQAYHMMVNPSGVQLDALNNAAGNEDPAPDWIWDSAGRVGAEGYVVEIRLPLQSIRMSGGRNARMGILFWRRVSRLGVSVAWPALDPGVWVFERNASLMFDDIAPRLVREVLPSITYSRSQSRASLSGWSDAAALRDIGMSGKVGLTSTITLDATVNPDFSQVESDAFQVQVNQRFPVFFGEKRPFFMEGSGLFSLAGAGGDSSIRTAVHTRRIVDPIFGAKLTGTAGGISFGTLSAVDDADVPDGPTQRVFNIGRAQYSLGPSDYVGVLAADTWFRGGYNRLAGVDFRRRLTDRQRVSGFALMTWSRDAAALQNGSGAGGQVKYDYESRAFSASGVAEHYDPGFRMDTGFINRVGITSGWGFADRSFYPDAARYTWIRRVALFSFTQGGSDRGAGGGEFLEVAGVRFNFTRQGFLRIDRSFGWEHWQARRFERGRVRAFGNVQLFRWLSLDGNVSTGKAVFYDSVNPYQGSSRDVRGGFNLQPNGQFSQSISFTRIAFDREATGQRVYTLAIVNGKTTYQFTRALSLRAITQFDSSRETILGDVLGSYEPRPGTVLYAGYGALLERKDFVEGDWVNGEGAYLTTRRGVFLKASYLHRF